MRFLILLQTAPLFLASQHLVAGAAIPRNALVAPGNIQGQDVSNAGVNVLLTRRGNQPSKPSDQAGEESDGGSGASTISSLTNQERVDALTQKTYYPMKDPDDQRPYHERPDLELPDHLKDMHPSQISREPTAPDNPKVQAVHDRMAMGRYEPQGSEQASSGLQEQRQTDATNSGPMTRSKTKAQGNGQGNGKGKGKQQQTRGGRVTKKPKARTPPRILRRGICFGRLCEEEAALAESRSGSRENLIPHTEHEHEHEHEGSGRRSPSVSSSSAPSSSDSSESSTHMLLRSDSEEQLPQYKASSLPSFHSNEDSAPSSSSSSARGGQASRPQSSHGSQSGHEASDERSNVSEGEGRA